jgi:hypothetical protein
MPAVWSDWTPDVAIDVPGCPAPTIELAVKQTVIDFCERTHWLRRTPLPIDATSGAGAKSFGSPLIVAGENVQAILKAWLSGEPIEVVGPDDVEDDWPDWKTRVGDPERIVMESIDTYYIVPALAVTRAAALTLKIAVGYTLAATGCDDSIRQHWRDAIADGAKARLMSIPNQKWTSPELAGVWQQRYVSAVKGAEIRALRTPARRPLATKPYWF